MPPDFAVDEDVPLWELIQTSHLAGRGFTAVFAAVGLTPTQYGVLAHLARERGFTQAELARRVLVRPQSMGELVGSLLDRGLVERDGPGGRGRRSRLRLTEAGRDMVRRARPGVLAFNAPAAIGLTSEESATLVRLLRQVRAALSELG